MAKRELQEINAGSMADIAFLLLIFFLVTTTMDVDTGLLGKLPPPAPEIEPDTPPVKKRNTFIVLINKDDKLLVEGEPLRIEQLKDKAVIFLKNETNKANLPQKEIKQIKLIGEFAVSKGIVSLQNDRGTSYEAYIHVKNELLTAYREVRDEVSMQYFGKKFNKFDKENLEEAKMKKAVKRAIPQRLSEAEPKNIGGTE